MFLLLLSILSLLRPSLAFPEVTSSFQIDYQPDFKPEVPAKGDPLPVCGGCVRGCGEGEVVVGLGYEGTGCGGVMWTVTSYVGVY